MKRFEIIIKDLEKGETIKKIKTNCIIGAVSDADDNKVVSIGLTKQTFLKFSKQFKLLRMPSKKSKSQFVKKIINLITILLIFLMG